MRSIQLLILLISLCRISYSQNENSKWYFGSKMALDFMSDPPTTLTNNTVSPVGPASSSIADEQGNLLFFTDSKTIWNKDMAVMPNGTGLQNFWYYYQAPLIVKQPGSQNLYYIFTLDSALRYSLVDMSLASGTGSVISKNVLVYANTSLKICGTKHCNGTDVWIITHELYTNNFRSHLLTSAGLNTSAVISSAGTSYTFTGQEMGHLKCSPSGKQLGVAIYRIFGGPGAQPSSIYEVYDFDKSTGVVSNAITLRSNFPTVWSCEFSPDGTKFYGTGLTSLSLHQWDLCAGSPASIIASHDSLFGSSIGHGLQLATNGKIYSSHSSSLSLGVINYPNNFIATCCNATIGPSIPAGSSTGLSLPNFVSSSLKTPFTFTSGYSCHTVSFTSSYVPSAPVCSNVADPINLIEWFFGEPSSGAANTSTLNNPNHQYAAPGTYKVKLAIHAGFCVPDTIVQFVTLDPPPPISVSGNYTICPGNSSTVNVSGASSYTWSNGAISNSVILSPSITTVYSVSGSFTNTSCTSTQTFTVVKATCVNVEEEVGIETQLKIFPNPFNTEFTIDTKIPISVFMYNQMGILLDEFSFKEGLHAINTAHFPSGVYLLKITSGEQKFYTKLIKAD